MKLDAEPVVLQYGCGIYRVGTNGLKMFVTDRGFVLPIEGKMLGEQDLVAAYVRGRIEEQECYSGQRDEQ